MRKEIIRISTIGLAFILLLCLLLQPVYKMNKEFIYSQFDDEIVEIINQEPDAFFDHTFKSDSFKEVNDKLTIEDMSWELYLSSTEYQDTDKGLNVKESFRLVQNDFPDFVTIAIFASGKNSQVKVLIDDELIGEASLEEEVKRYDFTKETSSSSKLEIIFTSNEEITLQRIKINEYEPYTKEQAKVIFLRDIIMHSGLITTNPKLVNIDSYELYEEYINEEVQSLLEGVPFFSLFKMAIEDIEYDLSLFNSLSGMSLKERIDAYKVDRRCPFISILMFIMSGSLIGSIVYVAIRFVLDLMFKKSSNYIIPSLIILGSFAVILNISTFTNVNFFYGDHNIANKWRILFFEVSRLTPTFVISAILSIAMVAVQFVNILLDYLENKKNKKQNSKTKVIVYASILSSFTILILTGLIFK